MGKLAKRFVREIQALAGDHGARAELARKTGLHRRTIDRWAVGERIPDLDQVELVAGALERDPLLLLSDTEKQPWANVPNDILDAIGRVNPAHYDAIRALLSGFAIQKEKTRLRASERDDVKKRR